MRLKFIVKIIFVSVYILTSTLTDGFSKVIVTQKDKSILEEKLNKFSSKHNLSTGALMLAIGADFKGTPYVAQTLDRETEENLVVNLRELDCTTFVESCLAIARTIKSGNSSFDTFITELEKIRYRSGHLDGYVSRLHYFSEWITDNETKGIVKDVTSDLGGVRYPLSLDFMGVHRNSYPQLKENPPLVRQIKLIEKRISKHTYYSIPKEMVPDHESQFADGDIIALTTKIAGLDVSHLGLICRINGQLYLLNASSRGGKVETTPVSLYSYLKNSKITSGIFVVRAI